eukprot:9039762-Heterocapsa_arctica.AAC.1
MAALSGLPSPDEPLPHTGGVPWRIRPGSTEEDIKIRDSLEMLPSACSPRTRGGPGLCGAGSSRQPDPEPC